MQAQQLRRVALADAQAQVMLAVEHDYRFAGRGRGEMRMYLAHHIPPKVHGERPAVPNGLHRRARDVGNQVAVVVHVGDVARHAVVLNADLAVVQLMKSTDDGAQASERLALRQGYGGGQ